MAKFTFIDLFAGIGGFHAALTAMGGECVYAVEIDEAAAAVYEKNWHMKAQGDITLVANDDQVLVPEHDVLCAGFPCQPFSKSGAQRGMDETRGTLYWNILRIIETHHPKVVLLENVRNLAGPRHRHEWQVIIETLRAEGYRVSETPAIFSPHLLPPDRGGRPPVRERVFITATLVGADLLSQFGLEADPAVTNSPVAGWEADAEWDLADDLPLDDFTAPGCALSPTEERWIDAWDAFVERVTRATGRRLPGHPIWADEWNDPSDPEGQPKWKADFIRKNASLYAEHKELIDEWAEEFGVFTDLFPPSRRKLEWQAQDTPSLWETVMHLRPSGIRAKRPTYLPALVAITQTSIIGERHRRLSPREAARLQGFPDWFDFGDQPDAKTYRQLGNGVSVGAVWHVLRKHVERDEEILKLTRPELLKAVLDSPPSPDQPLADLRH